MMNTLARLPLLCLILLCSFPLFAAPAASPLQGGMEGVEVVIAGPDTLIICAGEVITLEQTNNVNDEGLIWRPAADFISSTTTPNPQIAPTASRYYVVTVGTPPMTASDSVYIEVNQLVVPDLPSDTSFCQGTAMTLVQSEVVNSRGTTYSITPTRFVDDPTDINTVVSTPPGEPTTLTVIATSRDSVCADTQRITVTLIRSRLSFDGPDTLFRCNTVELDTLGIDAGPNAGPLNFFPNTGIVQQNGSFLVVEVTNNITYYVNAEVNGCPQSDSIHIRVDSLPEDLTLTAEPEKDPYCVGDTFFLLGNIFEVGDYPLIRHRWLEAVGLESPEELYNGVFTAQDTFLAQRETTNGACIDTAELQINVIPPPILIFDPPNPVVCPGEPVEVTVTFDPSAPNGEIEWVDSLGLLSCTECLDPTITVSQTTTFDIMVTAEGSECMSTASYTVVVDDSPETEPIFTSQVRACPGESRSLFAGGINPDYTYRITGGGLDTDDTAVLVAPTEETTYTVAVEGRCMDFTRSITLSVQEPFTIDVEAPDGVCQGDVFTAVATVNPASTEGTFRFEINDGEAVRSSQLSTTELADGDVVAFSFTDALGCFTETEAITVNVSDAGFRPEVAVSRPDGASLVGGSVIAGSDVTFTVTNVPDDFMGTFNWRGGGDPATGTGRSITVTAPDSNLDSLEYAVTVADEFGCTSIGSTRVGLAEVPFRTPEIISANRDGLNDNFQLFFANGVAVADFTLIVYNRWGQEVFESSDPGEGWDGTTNGKPQNLGTYLYLAKFRIDGQEFTEDGQFTLVR